MNRGTAESVLLKCFLRKSGDDRNCIWMTSRHLFVSFKGRKQEFSFSEVMGIRVARKKLIILLIVGGIGTSFSMAALPLGWYDYYLNIYVIIAFFATMYFGYVGKEALEIHEKRDDHIYLLWKNVPMIEAFVHFYKSYRHQRMSTPGDIIYHISARDLWYQQLENEYYVHGSLADEGFIHCSKYENVLETFQLHYTDPGQYLLVLIDETGLEKEVKYEYATSRRIEFPHVYGQINKTAIIELVGFATAHDLKDFLSGADH